MREKRVLGIVFILAVNLMSSGCGLLPRAKLTLTPEPNSIVVDYSKKCGRVQVNKPDLSQMTEFDRKMIYGFANELENSGLCEEVFYHTLPEGPVDLALDLSFEATPHLFWDEENATNEEWKQMNKQVLPKTLLLTLSLGMIPAPYNEDYYLKGKAVIYKNNKEKGVVDGQFHAHWHGTAMGIIAIEEETKEEFKKVLYKQLITGITDYCESK